MTNIGEFVLKFVYKTAKGKSVAGIVSRHVISTLKTSVWKPFLAASYLQLHEWGHFVIFLELIGLR